MSFVIIQLFLVFFLLKLNWRNTSRHFATINEAVILQNVFWRRNLCNWTGQLIGPNAPALNAHQTRTYTLRFFALFVNKSNGEFIVLLLLCRAITGTVRKTLLYIFFLGFAWFFSISFSIDINIKLFSTYSLCKFLQLFLEFDNFSVYKVTLV